MPKYGHSAAERNRLKRRLREIVRTRVLGTLPPVDAVIRVRPSTFGISFSQLADELAQSADEARYSNRLATSNRDLKESASAKTLEPVLGTVIATSVQHRSAYPPAEFRTSGRADVWERRYGP